MDFYRFSIKWPWILPDGDTSNINEDGIKYYENLINDLLHHKIEPMVTIYHVDLPQSLQEMGGWANPAIADFFEDYARLLFERLGPLVKWWVTIDEPGHITRLFLHKYVIEPYYQLHTEWSIYLATATLLKAHARAYHMYNKEFCPSQGGKIGISLNSCWFDPQTTSREDCFAATTALQFDIGIFAHPIFSKSGDFPEIVKQKVAEASRVGGLRRSKLPKLSEEWVQKIKNSADFLAVSCITKFTASLPGESDMLVDDSRVHLVQYPCEPGCADCASGPFLVQISGFPQLLNWVKTEYENPPVVATENEFSESGEEDSISEREKKHFYYQVQLRKAKEGGSNILGHALWSITDNFLVMLQ